MRWAPGEGWEVTMESIIKFRKSLSRVSRAFALVALYVLFITALMVSVDVIVRKLFNIAFVGVDELAGYALALATSWSLSFAFFEGSHIRVNVLHMNLKPAPKAWLDVMAVLAMAVLIALLAWQVWVLLLDSWMFNAESNTPLRTPLWIPQSLYFAGVVLFLVSALVVFLEGLIRAIRRDYDAVIELVEEREQVGEYTL